jgi:hypothetical protein
MFSCGARLDTKPRSAGGLAAHPRLPEVDEIRRHTALLKSLSADFPSEARTQKRTLTNDGELRRPKCCYPLRGEQKAPLSTVVSG